MLNLISNAIKYHSENRPLKVDIKSSLNKSNEIVIQVKDNGIGIDLEKHGNEIFAMYKRFDSHTEGKGLGLYLIKNQVESLGGRISVKSTLGKGSLFTVKLPK